LTHQLYDSDKDLLFRKARTYNSFTSKEVSEDVIHSLYELWKWCPTSANSCPMRVTFVKSAKAKEKLVPLMSAGNQEKVKKAPVTALVGYDMEFYEKLPFLFPAMPDAKSYFLSQKEKLPDVALQSSSLQAAFLIMSARALGLSCGPMVGANFNAISSEFSPNGKIKFHMAINIGYGDESTLYPRSPRLKFEEANKIV